MALYALYRGAVHVGGEALCTKSNALIQLNMVANGSGFAYYHACAVVYEKISAYGGAGVYVYTGIAVGYLGHETGKYGHLHLVQLMGNAVYAYCLKAGVGKHYLLNAYGRRVPLIARLGVSFQRRLDIRQRIHQPVGNFLIIIRQYPHYAVRNGVAKARAIAQVASEHIGVHGAAQSLQKLCGLLHKSGIAAAGGTAVLPAHAAAVAERRNKIILHYNLSFKKTFIIPDDYLSLR